MLTDADKERCANFIIRRHGPAAAFVADLRAVELRLAGEPRAAETWLRVKAAIERMQRGQETCRR